MRLNRLKSTIAALLAAIIAPIAAHCADTAVKREMRSSWVATVWRLDWPPSVVTSTGNTSQINAQKQALITMLDSLSTNNFNAINLQVRSRSDAMYNSAYEPWSSDLVSYRGMDPGWDPLAFAVEECHKRGMECHAWINPYRYESSVSGSSWTGANDYRTTHPDWIMEYNDQSILNPGLAEVRQRICDVIKDILQKYDVDGVLFDDYFYIGNTPLSVDADLYNAYKSAGGTLTQANWRRENVNQMIADVYATINATKPWVRFGVSPAGVAGTSSSVASQYGVSTCPSGSDWQYNQIYSDPLAWVSRNILDFISPQVYWTIGYTTADYSKITPWWGEVANKFGRHLYVSHSISSLSSTSKAPGMTGMEQSLAAALDQASGPNSATFSEYANEVRLNRSSSLDGNPGSVFYSTKYIYSTAPLFGHYLKTTVFNTPALTPAMTWKTSQNPGLVTNLTRDGASLTWNGYDNVRYSVYAVPSTVPTDNFQAEPEYLMGVSYTNSYTIPDNRLAGYNYAVCVLDRYGYEYSPAFADRPTVTLDAPTLVSPADGATVEYPFEMTWNAVSGASSYIVEVASDPSFALSSLLYTSHCSSTTCPTDNMTELKYGQKYYWRVRACGVSANDGISDARSFNLTRVVILSPADGAENVELQPALTWSIPSRDVTVEMATSDDFNTILISEDVTAGTWNIPAGYLAGLTTYYCRLQYKLNGQDMTSPVISFTTVEVEPGEIAISYPQDGGDFYADDYVSATVVPGYYQVTFQIDTKEAVGSRYIQETSSMPTWHSRNKASEMSKTLTENTLYYMRVRGTYRASSGNKTGDWSPVISAYYRGANSGIASVNTDGFSASVADGNLIITAPAASAVTATATSAAGIDMGRVFEGRVNGTASVKLPSWTPGIYLINVSSQAGNATVKAIIR